MASISTTELPGLDCGLCGYRTCAAMAQHLPEQPELLKRCLHLSQAMLKSGPAEQPQARLALRPGHEQGRAESLADPRLTACSACSAGAGLACAGAPAATASMAPAAGGVAESPLWRDSLGREFDFYLEHFPEDPGPREIIIPHNPMITREMDVQVGDVLIGRPLGISCGCPITHCGVAVKVEARTGVIVWCVTGPLQPRQHGYKDLGYYIAEGYEGLVRDSRADLRIGMRYFFQPRMCMLQWRHSGLVNYINRSGAELQVRLEGLWIG